MTTPQEYSRALMFYIGTLIVFVAVLSFLGPRVLSLNSSKVPETSAALPMFVALVLVGLLPSVPWLQQIELQLRRFAHERAYIPRAARAAADKLAAADFDFSAYDSGLVLNSPGMRAVEPSDFAAARDTVEYAWARLSALLYQLRRRQDAGLTMPFDGEVLQLYARDLDNLLLKRKSLEDDIIHYREEKQKNVYYSNDDLHRTIRKMLQQLYILLGCAVRLKLSPTFIREFGFDLESDDKGVATNTNLMTVGLGVMTVCVFLAIYVAIAIGRLATFYGVWTPSESFPHDLLQPFPWAISALLAHGTAIFVANWLRRLRRPGTRPFAVAAAVPKRNAATYVYAAILSGAAGFVVNFLWGLVFISPSLRLAVYAAPTALLPAATGAFYIFHLDNVELQERPARYIEIGSQALVTGFCGFAASSAQYAMYDMQPLLDNVLLTAGIGVIIGASLAWYIPRAADRSAHDPLMKELNLRVVLLRNEATKIFGGRDRADAWIEAPNVGLANHSPRESSADIALFEKALSLLRAQQQPEPGHP